MPNPTPKFAPTGDPIIAQVQKIIGFFQGAQLVYDPEDCQPHVENGEQIYVDSSGKRWRESQLLDTPVT